VQVTVSDEARRWIHQTSFVGSLDFPDEDEGENA
jgi:hypothetical protein